MSNVNSVSKMPIKSGFLPSTNITPKKTGAAASLFGSLPTISMKKAAPPPIVVLQQTMTPAKATTTKGSAKRKSHNKDKEKKPKKEKGEKKAHEMDWELGDEYEVDEESSSDSSAVSSKKRKRNGVCPQWNAWYWHKQVHEDDSDSEDGAISHPQPKVELSSVTDDIVVQYEGDKPDGYAYIVKSEKFSAVQLN